MLVKDARIDSQIGTSISPSPYIKFREFLLMRSDGVRFVAGFSH